MRPFTDERLRCRRISELLVMVAVCLLGAGATRPAVADETPQVKDIRYFSGPEYTRVVMDLSDPADWEFRLVEHPERIAINVQRTVLPVRAAMEIDDGVVRRVRRNPGATRAQIVLDLDGPRVSRCFELEAGEGKPHRIVVDVFRKQEPSDIDVARETEKPFTVIIDPGHGGSDPGAARSGLREKDVVLDVARTMKHLIDGLPGYRAVLTRNSDHSLSLARRVEVAVAEGGDLFLSVHCNAHRRAQVAGMEVYFLSLQGASDQRAQELADVENAADLVGMPGGDRTDDLVLNILMDLRANQMLHESAELAEYLLAATDQDGVVRPRKVKQANFRVLHSLAMPSALVELAYLSNTVDRKLLAQRSARQSLAASLVGGLLAWRRDEVALARLGRQQPEIWTRRYRVKQGDNLWRLARHHGTTVAEISSRNRLQSNSISVGQVLRLPQEYQSP